jgi:hypothetical protein
MDATITTVRHVTAWYYLLTALAAITAITWLAQRRLLRLGGRLLGLGICLNGLWELALFTVWGRQYETPVPTLVHAVYQSLTEFGPLLVLAVLALSHTRYISLDGWYEPRQTQLHTAVRTIGFGLLVSWSVVVLTLVITSPTTLHIPVTVTRHVTPVYFMAEALLAVTVLAIALTRRNRIALLLFIVMGTFNVLFEVIGLIGGYRTYHDLTAYAAFLIGLSESGTAAALVWMVSTATVIPFRGPVVGGTQEATE